MTMLVLGAVVCWVLVMCRAMREQDRRIAELEIKMRLVCDASQKTLNAVQAISDRVDMVEDETHECLAAANEIIDAWNRVY